MLSWAWKYNGFVYNKTWVYVPICLNWKLTYFPLHSFTIRFVNHARLLFERKDDSDTWLLLREKCLLVHHGMAVFIYESTVWPSAFQGKSSSWMFIHYTKPIFSCQTVRLIAKQKKRKKSADETLRLRPLPFTWCMYVFYSKSWDNFMFVHRWTLSCWKLIQKSWNLLLLARF